MLESILMKKLKILISEKNTLDEITKQAFCSKNYRTVLIQFIVLA